MFRFVGLTHPRSSGSKFHAKIRNQTEDSLTFVYSILALGLLDDAEVEINDVLQEGDNTTFIVRI